MKKSLCLLRHASISSEYQGRYIGRRDVSISSDGYAEIKILRQQIPSRFQEGKVYLSPANRAKETFTSLEFPNSCDLEIREELQELDFGDWEGKLFSEIWNSNPESLQDWAEFKPQFRFPGGESLENFRSRAQYILNQILVSEYKNILILSHGGILSLILTILLGLGPSSHTRFRFSPSSFALLEVYKNRDAVLTDLVRIPQNRRCEWPG